MDKINFDKAKLIYDRMLDSKMWVIKLNHIKENKNHALHVNGYPLWRISDDPMYINGDFELNKKITEMVIEYFKEKNEKLEKEFIAI